MNHTYAATIDRRRPLATVFLLTALMILGLVLPTPAAGAAGAGSVPAAKPDLPKAVASVDSPHGGLKLRLSTDGGQLQYAVQRKGKTVVLPSHLGLQLTDGTTLGKGVTVVSSKTTKQDTTWNPLWGSDKAVRDSYQQVTLKLRQKDGRQFSVIARAYDDGVAFRYDIPKQASMTTLEIVDEDTEFALAGDPTAWWTDRSFSTDENEWKSTPYSQMGASNTPVTFRYADGTHLSIHEADLTDYAAMTVEPRDGRLRAALVPTPNRQAAVVTSTGRSTPWRSLTITDNAGDLIESHLLENLNPPCDPSVCTGDTSWIKPVKYVGIWWLMQQGQATWEEGPRHGATTERAKQYIDFAAANGIQGLLAEGWNKGWEGSWADQSYTQSADDFDLPAVVAYGKSKGVEFIAHNETGAGIENYESQIDAAFSLYQSLGIHYIKTGYVGTPEGENQYDQRMVNHFRLVLQKAAQYKINVDCHECVHGTGEVRTFPNALSREAMRGQEWDAFSSGNTPQHTMILPFTRMLSGPMDYTPGIMDILWDPQNQGRRVHTTVGKQLAYYVNYFSGVQMAADLPEHYQDAPGLKFIEDVPTTWDQTEVLSASVGEQLVTARRSGQSWYVGAMNGEDPANLTYSLKFLRSGTWVAETYTDAAANDYDHNPTALTVNRFLVTPGDQLTASLPRSGGQAVRLIPATADDKRNLPRYKAPTVSVQSLTAPKTATANDLVDITAKVKNTGSLPLRSDVTMKVRGTGISQTRPVSIDPGATQDVTFQIRVPSSGSSVVVQVEAAKATIRIKPGGTVPAPQDLTVTGFSSDFIDLAWKPVDGTTSYQVFRRTEQGIYSSTPTATLDGTATTYHDTDVTANTTYSYVVRAVRSDGVSIPSNELTQQALFQLGERVGGLTDPAGDDNGPGSYVYPTDGAFNPGAFDLTNFDVYRNGSNINLVTRLAGQINNPWGGNGMSVQRLNIYLHDTADTATTSTPALPGTNMNTAGAWTRAIVADGRNPSGMSSPLGVYGADGTKIADVNLQVVTANNQIVVTIPATALGALDPATAGYQVSMFGDAENGEGIGNVRPVYDYDYWNAGDPWWVKQYRFGGGAGVIDDALPSKDTDTSDPNAIDIISGAAAQADVLNWKAGSPVTAPYLTLGQ